MKLSDVSKQIKNKTKVTVKGQVDYSHIATKIAGEELQKANQYTNYPSKDPYYKLTITVDDPKGSITFDQNDTSETYLAAYLASKVYESKKEENKGKQYNSFISKGNEIRVYKKDSQGKLHKVDLNGNELAAGSNVECELQFFETSSGVGVGLNAVVILDEEIQVYKGQIGVKGYDEIAEDTITLEARKPMVVDDTRTASDAAETPVVDEPVKPTAPEVAEEPIGSTAAPANADFDNLLAKFKMG